MSLEFVTKIVVSFVKDSGMDIVKILGFILGAGLLNKILKKGIDSFFVARIKKHIDDESRTKRLTTLAELIKGTVRFLIGVVLVLMILSEVGINVGPLIASLGIAGIAVGMGVNTMIADFVAGFFIILEDRFHVGDKIRVPTAGGVEGRVKEISLKNTVLEDEEGNLHIIRNSKMDVVTRYKE